MRKITSIIIKCLSFQNHQKAVQKNIFIFAANRNDRFPAKKPFLYQFLTNKNVKNLQAKCKCGDSLWP